MNVTTIGLDLAKSVFQVHGIGSHGKTLITKQLRRGKVLEFFANCRPAWLASRPVPARTTGRARSASSGMRCV